MKGELAAKTQEAGKAKSSREIEVDQFIRYNFHSELVTTKAQFVTPYEYIM